MKQAAKGVRQKRARYSPVQVYVSDDTVAMWAEVERVVAAEKATNPKASVTGFVNRAVQAALGK